VKSDLDALMRRNRMNALWIAGRSTGNPAMRYFTGQAHLMQAYVLKMLDAHPILFHIAMEREEAQLSGLATVDLERYGFLQLLEEHAGDWIAAEAEMIREIFAQHGVQGRVALYGCAELGVHYAVYQAVAARCPDVEIIGEPLRLSTLASARASKAPDEIEMIRRVGQAVVGVVDDLVGFLTTHRAEEGRLINRQGQALTVGEVKRRINLWLALRDLENPEGTIFSIGAEAGVPHSHGADQQVIPVGQAVILDLYPRQAGGGYFFDMTRTWCLGPASETLLRTHQDVLEVYQHIFPGLAPGQPCRELQSTACRLFEARGHPTGLSSTKTQTGYVHNLGHGVGLSIHEAPFLSMEPANTAILQPGNVITLEPGLYYPEEGIGVRGPELLADYPKDLVLPIEGV
jgi:Xaa-Pro aminopeptidase